MEFHILYIADGHTSFSQPHPKFQSLLREIKNKQQIYTHKQRQQASEREKVASKKRERDEN